MELKGMTIDQFKELVKHVQEKHSFYGFNSTYAIKYIDSCYDSRSSDIWSVSFRGSINLRFSTNSLIELNDFKYTSLFDWIMAYLQGNWIDENIIEKYVS